MNVTKSHEYYEITDTYNGKEVTGFCTYISDNNLSVTITIKDPVNGDQEVGGYVAQNPTNTSVSVSYDKSYNVDIIKYMIDMIATIINQD